MHRELATVSSPTSQSVLMSCSYEASGCVLNQCSNILYLCFLVSLWLSSSIMFKSSDLSPNARPNLCQLLTWRCIRSFSSGFGSCEPKQGGTNAQHLKFEDARPSNRLEVTHSECPTNCTIKGWNYQNLKSSISLVFCTILTNSYTIRYMLLTLKRFEVCEIDKKNLHILSYSELHLHVPQIIQRKSVFMLQANTLCSSAADHNKSGVAWQHCNKKLYCQ